MRAHVPCYVAVVSVGMALLFGPAASASLIENHSITVNDSGSNFVAGAWGEFSLPQFDDWGGTRILEAVTLRVRADFFGGSNSLDSESLFAGTASVMIGSGLFVDAPLSLSVSLVQPSESSGDMAVTADDEAGFPDFVDAGGGDDCVSVAGQDVTDVQSIALTNPPDDLSAYIGSGTITISFSSSITSMASATVGPTWAYVDAPTFCFDAEIIYTYVPEPGTMSVLALGGLAIVRHRQK